MLKATQLVSQDSSPDQPNSWTTLDSPSGAFKEPGKHAGPEIGVLVSALPLTCCVAEISTLPSLVSPCVKWVWTVSRFLMLLPSPRGYDF